MASNMTLYMRNGACSFIPHTLLNEINASYKTITMDFDKNTRLAAADGSFTHDDYKKIHHAGYVPALQVDNETITELPAICNYIAGLKPDDKLTGNTLLEQAKHEELMCYMSGELHGQGFGALWRSRRFTDSTDQTVHEGIQAGGKKRILAALDRLDGLLTGTHAFGDKLTVADVTIYNFWRWGALRMGFELEEFQKRYPKLTALAKEVESVPSVKKTLEEEKLPLVFA
jgi:glutathione S-transferase